MGYDFTWAQRVPSGIRLQVPGIVQVVTEEDALDLHRSLGEALRAVPSGQTAGPFSRAQIEVAVDEAHARLHEAEQYRPCGPPVDHASQAQPWRSIRHAHEALHRVGAGQPRAAPTPESPPGLFGVAVVLRRRSDGAVLFGQRKGAYGEGTWSLAGGKPRPGEHPLETAWRELAEETGIAEVDGLRLMPFWSWDGGVGGVPDFVTIWAEAWVGEGVEPVIAEPDKCAGWRWVTPDEELPRPLFRMLSTMLDQGRDLWVPGCPLRSDVVSAREELIRTVLDLVDTPPLDVLMAIQHGGGSLEASALVAMRRVLREALKRAELLDPVHEEPTRAARELRMRVRAAEESSR